MCCISLNHYLYFKTIKMPPPPLIPYSNVPRLQLSLIFPAIIDAIIDAMMQTKRKSHLIF